MIIIYTADNRKPGSISAVTANKSFGTVTYKGDGDKKGEKH